ncbi:MAG: hypothetical protein KF901_27225 [Myxococcales bacterium]|nr:hypothetical protein [Myxococcales bacterium]
MRIVSVAIALSLAACAAQTRHVGPERTLAAWSDGVRRGDAVAIRALLDEDTREGLSADEVERLLTENQEELRGQLGGADPEALEARAVVPLRDGERAVLVLEGGEWKLTGTLLGVPALVTPEDAVRELRRALRRPPLRGVLSVLARRPRAVIEAEIERFLDESEDELAWETEVGGNDASVRTAGGWLVRLVREAGEWRVEDVEAPTP